MALPEAIKPIAEDDQQFARILIHGDSGVGKTTLAAGSPNCLMLFNDPDEGTYAASQDTKAHRWTVRDYDDLTEAVEFLKLGRHDFEWAWLDNASIFQDQGMQQVMEDLVAAKPHRNMFIPDKAEYMLNQSRLMFLLRELKSLPMHVGVVANSMTVADDEGNEHLMPLFQGGQGSLSNKICGMMSVVAYMEVVEAKKPGSDERVDIRRIVTNKTRKVYAKDRYGVLGTMQNPSMEKLLAKIPSRAVRPKKSAARRPVGTKVDGAVAKRTATSRPTKKSVAARRTATPK